MHPPVSPAASPAASRARARAKVLLATMCVAIAAITLAACFDRTTAPPPSLAPVPRHDFLGDANWGANNSAASGSYDGVIDTIRGGALPAAKPLGPIVYPTFITATVAGQVRQVPRAVQGSGIVRDPYSTNDPSFWGSMGFRSNGSIWWPVGYTAVLRVVAPIAPFRNDAGGQPYGDALHCGIGGYMLCWSWEGTAHFEFSRIHIDLTLARIPDSTVVQGTAVVFTGGMSQTTFPGNPYSVDFSAQAWRWLPDSGSITSDTLPCNSVSGRSCTKVLQASGTMYTSAYVNGEQQQQSVHVNVKVPTLALSAAQTVLATPGDTDVFTPSGNGAVVVKGWAFAEDVSGVRQIPPIAVGSTWGNCSANAPTCRNFVPRSGTVRVVATVDGVQLTAAVHVTVIKCPIPGETFLNDSIVRVDLLRAMSNSGWLANPGEGLNSPTDSVGGNKREVSGDFWMTPAGEYYFGRDTLAWATECRTMRSAMDTRRSPTDVKVGDFHTEPTENWLPLYGCGPSVPEGKLAKRNPYDSTRTYLPTKPPPSLTGGGSLSDWFALRDLPENANAATPTVSGYVMHANGEIWKLPADKLRDSSLWLSNHTFWNWYRNPTNPSCNW